MSTSSKAIESSSDAVVPTELPSNSDIALSNDVKVAVGDDLLEPSTGTLTTEPSSVHDGGDTVVHDSVNDARVSGDESEIVMENVEKILDEKEKEVNDEEKEGEFKVSDLVWAKVRNYPWWPGQIFDPSASTDVAKKHSNKKGFLIAYFGDQSFAWNEKSKIKPFRKNFIKMEKQSNSPKFLHAVNCALDEALRRIKFGLSCSCLSKEVYDSIKSQTFVNAGIKKEDSVINGGDNFSTAATFKPGNIVQSVQDLAKEQFDGFNRFQVLSLHTQLFAYYRWKGYHQFSTQYFLDGSDEKLEDNTEIPKIEKPDSVDEKVSSKKRKIKDYSLIKEKDKKVPLIGKPDSVDEKVSSKKRKIKDDFKIKEKDKKVVTVSEKVSKKRESNGSDSVKLKKHKHTRNDDMIVKKKENLLTKVPLKGSSKKEDSGKSRNGIPIPTPKRLFGVGDSICKIAKQLSVSPLIPKTEESTKSKRSNSSLETSKEKIAKKESQFQSSKESNSIDEKRVDQTEESTKSDESTKSESKSVTSDSSLKESKEKFAKKESKFRRSKESNSVDENPVDQAEESTKAETKSLINDSKEKFAKKESQFRRSKESNSVDENRVDQTDESTKSETKSVTIDSGLKASKEKFSKTESQFQRSKESNSADENPVDQTEESTKSETSDAHLKTTKEKFTALILKFTNFDSIPSVPDLNDIFSKYGNVMESETEVLKKSNCAKVVFEEKSNAETAFSSAGKFSIFGPSLISYRLDYSPTPRKIYTRKGKKKNGKAIRFDD